MMDELLARNAVGTAEVDLACTLNHDHDMDGASQRLGAPAGADDTVARAAVRACLGDREGRARTLEGLVSPSEADVQIVQTYLRHRPLADDAELRDVTRSIVRMSESDAQVRALEALGRHRLTDGPSLEALVRLYSAAQSPKVQIAIAGILIRAEYASLDRPDLARTLRDQRRKAPAGDDMIDALIRRLQAN